MLTSRFLLGGRAHPAPAPPVTAIANVPGTSGATAANLPALVDDVAVPASPPDAISTFVASLGLNETVAELLRDEVGLRSQEDLALCRASHESTIDQAIGRLMGHGLKPVEFMRIREAFLHKRRTN